MARIEDLRERRYASICAPLDRREDAIAVSARGHEWFLSPLPDPSTDPELESLIRQLPHGRFEDEVIEFRLPARLRLADVESDFKLALEARNLNTCLDSQDGRDRLAQVGLPRNARLFTDYDLVGRRPRRSLASEISCLRPKRELGLLLRALLSVLP